MRAFPCSYRLFLDVLKLHSRVSQHPNILPRLTSPWSCRFLACFSFSQAQTELQSGLVAKQEAELKYAQAEASLSQSTQLSKAAAEQKERNQADRAALTAEQQACVALRAQLDKELAQLRRDQVDYAFHV